ncbi:MAG: thiol-disulfide isomerase [Chromatiaceae bacterium]|jgi:circadian clock protein KaiB|nr:MAG: thiol-disulfide isomerase [Chromatiaceae bacterium]
MNASHQPVSDADHVQSKCADDVLQEARVMPQIPAGLGYVLTLYVASLSPRSVLAIRSVKEVCEKHLGGQYSLEVIDIHERPALAKSDQILAAPTLIKRLPLPLRRLIGDMADEHRVLIGLDLRARADGSDPRD